MTHGLVHRLTVVAATGEYTGRATHRAECNCGWKSLNYWGEAATRKRGEVHLDSVRLQGEDVAA